MPDIQSVCDALADSVRGIEGLKAKGFAGAVTATPEAQVYTRSFDPRLVFSATPNQYALGLRVFVGAQDPRAAQKNLRAFMEPAGSTSIRAAVESDENWPEGVHMVEVTQIGRVAEVELGEAVYWFVEFEIDVIW
jgi:hypothetical protein